MGLNEDSNGDRTLANATNFLIQGEEYYEASILLLVKKIEISVLDEWNNDITLEIVMIADRAIYDIITDSENDHTKKILKAFNSVLPTNAHVEAFYGKVEYSEYSENWREALLEIVEGKRPLNQGIPIQDKERLPWQNLFFRSPVEVQIARVLDKTGALFLPNCMARLGIPGSRENREADFLVCYEGKWGILEINGETFHTSAAKDHDRGRLFKKHGIRVFETYDAKRCINEPVKVVKEFLEFLRNS